MKICPRCGRSIGNDGCPHCVEAGTTRSINDLGAAIERARETQPPAPNVQRYGCYHCQKNFSHTPQLWNVGGIPARTFFFCSSACLSAYLGRAPKSAAAGGSPHASQPPDLRESAEQLWESLGDDLCICQRADVSHWCEKCQQRIQILAEALTTARQAIPAPPPAQEQACPKCLALGLLDPIDQLYVDPRAANLGRKCGTCKGTARVPAAGGSPRAPHPPDLSRSEAVLVIANFLELFGGKVMNGMKAAQELRDFVSAAAHQAIPAPPPAWQPIGSYDKAKHPMDVLVATEHGVGEARQHDDGAYGKWMWANTDDDCSPGLGPIYPTHWMALPDPPVSMPDASKEP